MSRPDRNPIRENILDHVDRSERNFKTAILGAAVWEVLLLAAFVWKADFHNPTHLLMLISLVGGYTLICLGLVVLAMHINRSNLRILQAIEQTHADHKRAEEEMG